MPRRRDGSAAVTAAFAIAGSILLHLLLWPVGDRLVRDGLSETAVPRPGRAMEVTLLPVPEREPERDPTNPERRLPDGRIVQLDALEEERAPDRDTPYLSEFDHRATKPTRAPKTRPIPGAAPPAGTTPRSRPAREGEGQADRPGALALLGRDATRDPTPGVDLPEGEGPRRRVDTSPRTSPAGGAAGPTGAPGLSDAFRQTWGSPGTYDALDEDLEEGDRNLLDSRRFRFASFFNRLRQQVAAQWRPAEVHQARDPEGKLFGGKPRHTELAISLHPDGSVADIRLVASSGAPHLDEEAIRAVRAAAPFSNPPAQLVDPATRRIDFTFGFILEIGGTKRIFRYHR